MNNILENLHAIGFNDPKLYILSTVVELLNLKYEVLLSRKVHFGLPLISGVTFPSFVHLWQKPGCNGVVLNGLQELYIKYTE